MVEVLDGVLGLISVLELVVLEVPRPVEPPLRVMPVVTEPRARGVPTAFGLLNPDGLLNPVGPVSPLELPRPEDDAVPVDPGGVVGLMNIGVAVVFRELLIDEPLDDVGEQLTPGVIVDDGVGLVDVVAEAVPLVPVVPVVPAVPVVAVVPVPVRGVAVVCAIAGAALKAIAHARPAPPRIGTFNVLISMLILIRMISFPEHLRSL